MASMKGWVGLMRRMFLQNFQEASISMGKDRGYREHLTKSLPKKKEVIQKSNA
jgi:hypothetical protein